MLLSLAVAETIGGRGGGGSDDGVVFVLKGKVRTHTRRYIILTTCPTIAAARTEQGDGGIDRARRTSNVAVRERRSGSWPHGDRDED